MKFFLSSLMIICLCIYSNAQITTITPNITPAEAVEDIFAGSGVNVFNITFNGSAPDAMNQQASVQEFDASGTGFPISEGVLMSTDGPNLNDPDVDMLVNSPTNGAIIEFDFIATGDTLSFNYIFASSEYQNYTCSNFNDGLGFFLSGPGINGPFSNNAVNIATVPNTNIPVGINSVNSGTASGGSVDEPNCAAVDPNWQANSIYFTTAFNTLFTNSDYPISAGTSFNGNTVVLPATANLTQGETYHFKMAIANSFDASFLSGVFLAAKSFTTEEFSGVKGRIYSDINENCTKETTELGLEGITLSISPGGYIAEVNSSQEWYFDSLPIGTYTATIDTTNLNWTPTCSISQNFTVNDPQVYTQGPDFGLVNNNACSSPGVSIYAPFLRRCFSDQVVYIQACNEITGTAMIDSAYVEVELDSVLNPTSSSLPYTVIGNNIYRFELGDITPGQCVDFTINATVSCDALLGETLCMDANLYPVDSCNLDSIPTNPFPPTYGNNPNLVMPQQCTLPWDNSSLQVEGWCQGDSVHFSIANTGDFGDGDMDCYSPALLYVNDTLVAIDSVQLQGQETIYYSYPANGETWILAAEQHPLHPGNSHPNAHIELCGSDSTDWIPGMINNQPLDDADPVVDIYCGVVSGSYDPNDKTGFPLGVTNQNHIKPNQQLQYVVRFQNTGTDTALTVVIRDTLDTDLNIFTVTPGISSHDYTFRMYGPRVLEWTFNDIMLPDSTTDEPGSNGFITFTVEQVPNLPNGTLINNQADIYFDFNAPIITNETNHLINDMITSSPLNVEEILGEEGSKITVYPNPNNGLLFIELEEITKPIDYTITNISGQVVASGRLSQLKNAIDIQNLGTGLYLIQVDKSEPIKIIKE